MHWPRKQGTVMSESNSALAEHMQAKAETAKAGLLFAEKEALLKRRRAELDADLMILTAQKDLAVAKAEAKVGLG